MKIIFNRIVKLTIRAQNAMNLVIIVTLNDVYNIYSDLIIMLKI